MTQPRTQPITLKSRRPAVVPAQTGRSATTVLTVLTVAMFAAVGAVATAATWKPELLPREAELAAAVAAAPPHLAADAGVYLLTASGFALDRPSRNGFHCLLERSLPGAFEPQCLDAEGSATLLQGVLLRARLLMSGQSQDAIEREIAAAWSRGQLRPPSRPGINYMLSRENRVPIDDKGTVAPYRPHVMFYVPYLTNADLGGSPGAPGAPVFVINEGTPGAYAIVPVPEAAVAHPEHARPDASAVSDR